MEKYIKREGITFLLFNGKNNGGNKIVLHHATRLKKRGWDVKIVILFGTNQSWFPRDIQRLSLLSAVVRSHDKLVATFWPTAFLSLIIPANERFYLVQGREDQFYNNKLLNSLARITYNLPLKIVTTSKYLADGIKKAENLPTDVVVVPPYGVDGVMGNDKDSSNTSKINILSVVTTYSYTKGIDLLHKAVTKLKKIHPEYVFTLVSTEKQPYSEVFDTYYSNLTGDELATLYQNFDILLATGRSEGYFLPGIEAMASGVMLVTTDSGGVKSYAKNGHNAIILTKLSDLWEHDVIGRTWSDKGLRRKIISNGKKTANLYKWDEIIDRLEKAYNLTHP